MEIITALVVKTHVSPSVNSADLFTANSQVESEVRRIKD